MNVYITKMNGVSWNPLQSRQRMTAEIAHGLDCREMGIFCYNANAESEESLRTRLDGIVAGLSWGEDVVVCQFPTGNDSRFDRGLLERLKVYLVRMIFFIQNSEELVRGSIQARIPERIKLYNQAEALIVPSLSMRQFLLDNGIRKDMKFVIQEMWDYTIDKNTIYSPQFRKEIHFTCNGGINGLNNWNYAIPLKLYADSGIQGQNVHYIGGLSKGELISRLSKGGFGLVWYQDEDTRQGMEYDVSFDLARYLAAGIPVIVPAGISNQALIEKNHLGLVVDSLEAAVTAVESMEKSEYQGYIQSVGRFAPAIRKGYYTKKCLVDAVIAICRRDAGEIAVPAKIYDSGEHAFTYAVLKESYGDNLALSWNYSGKADGFLIYDTSGKLVYETRNVYQHYFLMKGCGKEIGFTVKAYVDTLKGKMILAESEQVCLQKERYNHASVSLIIPAYNAEEHIARSIDTALAQSLLDLEIIVVNDGSTDHTQIIIEWYAEKYTNVIAIRQENGGPAAARNTGIIRAGGEYIGFLDSDDMIRPEMMKRLYEAIKKNGSDIAITSAYYIKNGKYQAFIQYMLQEDTVVDTDEFIQLHYIKGSGFGVVVWNKLYRSSLVKAHLFPVLFQEDEAWIPYILSYTEKITYLNDCSYEYDRTTYNSTLAENLEKRSIEERFHTYKKAVTFYLENGNPKRVGLLKELAGERLTGKLRAYGYSEYGEFWEQIQETF